MSIINIYIFQKKEQERTYSHTNNKPAQSYADSPKSTGTNLAEDIGKFGRRHTLENYFEMTNDYLSFQNINQNALLIFNSQNIFNQIFQLIKRS